MFCVPNKIFILYPCRSKFEFKIFEILTQVFFILTKIWDTFNKTFNLLSKIFVILTKIQKFSPKEIMIEIFESWTNFSQFPIKWSSFWFLNYFWKRGSFCRAYQTYGGHWLSPSTQYATQKAPRFPKNWGIPNRSIFFFGNDDFLAETRIWTK